MYAFHSINELLNALVLGKTLLSEMFGKRRSFDYRYDQAVEVLDEGKVATLIEKGILTRNGAFVEIEDQLLSFFEQILDVSEEINPSFIQENITHLKENIDYYLSEDNEHRQYKYLKTIKLALRKLGVICLRNILDLNRNIDTAFKTEPNYKIKIKKLENYDQRRIDIKRLIAVSENLITEDELTFFSVARDEELTRITTELRLQLQEVRHNLIETERQIINFLNQVKHQNQVIEKVRKIKYLKDQYELEEHSDILEQLAKSNALVYETRPTFPVKLSLDLLQDDSTYEIIKQLSKKLSTGAKPKIPLAEAIDTDFFEDTEETDLFIDLEQIWNHFSASGYHLWELIQRYDFPKEMSFEELVTCYCQVISLYEAQVRFTDSYVNHKGTEFAIVYPQ